MPLGIDATIRYYIEQLAAPHPRVRAERRRAVQLPAQPRAAADADRQPRASPRSRPPRIRRTSRTCSSCASPARAASTPSPPRTRSSSATRRDYQAVAHGRNEPARRVRVAGGPLALAAHAQRGAAGHRPARLALPAAAAAAAPVRRDRQGAARRRLPRRQRDDPAQGGGARAGRQGHRGGDARSAPPTRSRSRPAASTPTTPTRAACCRAPALGLRAHGARARRRRVRPRRGLRAAAGGRGRRVWNRTHARAEALASEFGVTAVEPNPPRSSSTARPSAWRTRRARSRRFPCGPMNWVPGALSSTWSTATAAPSS